MNISEQISAYLDSLTPSKRSDMETLQNLILGTMSECQLWFFDGKDDTGKIVTNPQIGFGLQTIKYADGKTKDFYQVGISANATGISVYIMGIEDKNFLPNKYSNSIGKAKVTGYCIRFKKLQDINQEMLVMAIRDGVDFTKKVHK